MNINRDKYLNDLINRMHNGMIKVVTGIMQILLERYAHSEIGGTSILI